MYLRSFSLTVVFIICSGGVCHSEEPMPASLPAINEKFDRLWDVISKDDDLRARWYTSSALERHQDAWVRLRAEAAAVVLRPRTNAQLVSSRSVIRLSQGMVDGRPVLLRTDRYVRKVDFGVNPQRARLGRILDAQFGTRYPSDETCFYTSETEDGSRTRVPNSECPTLYQSPPSTTSKSAALRIVEASFPQYAGKTIYVHNTWEYAHKYNSVAYADYEEETWAVPGKRYIDFEIDAPDIIKDPPVGAFLVGGDPGAAIHFQKVGHGWEAHIVVNNSAPLLIDVTFHRKQ